MKQAAKQIAICALTLIFFCVVYRWTFLGTYTAHFPIHDVAELRREQPMPRIEAGTGVVHLGKKHGMTAF